MATRTEHICDKCGMPATLLKVNVPMRFTTEQTEGRPTKPYLEINKMDLCQPCMDRIIDGQPLSASGAQGHNQYIFRRKLAQPSPPAIGIR